MKASQSIHRGGRRSAGSTPVQFDALEPRRLCAAGALDLSYSTDGRQTIPLPNGQSLSAADVAVQSDGKTVVVGTMFSTGRNDFAVARLNVDGTLDLTFNANGADGPGFTRTGMGNEGRSNATGVAIQADGKIVVVGTARVDSLVTENELAVARYNTNGTLDNSFDGDGKRTFDFANFDSSNAGADVVIQPDGKIVCTGGTFRNLSRDFATIRLNPNGSFDRTFNGDGKAFTGFGGNEDGRALKVDTNGSASTNNLLGSVVVVGESQDRVHIVRLSAGGSESGEFDGDGKKSFSISGAVRTRVADLLIQPNGKVVIVGSVDRVNTPGDMYIARFNRNGALDTTFGSRGTGFDFVDFGGTEVAGGISRSPSGSGFVISGQSGGFVAAKFTNDGLIDTSFGTSGKVRLNFGGNARLAPGPGRRLTLAGGSLFASARILDSGANVVAAGSFQPNAFEQGQRVSGFIVTRSERLPVPTRVFFSVTGTARVNGLAFPGQPNPNDYTLTGITVPPPVFNAGPAFVDIPAGQLFTGVTLTPIDDTRVEGNETAIFTIVPSASYDLGTNAGTTITIFDNDGPASTTVNASADAFVRDGADAANNFGTGAVLDIKNSAVGFNRQAYLKFSIASLSTINTVKLRVFGSLSGTTNASIAAGVFSVADTSWTETGINFNNRPAISATALTGLTVTGATGAFYEVDVTNYVKAQKALGRTAVSFAILANAGSTDFIRLNARGAANGPALVVT